MEAKKCVTGCHESQMSICPNNNLYLNMFIHILLFMSADDNISDFFYLCEKEILILSEMYVSNANNMSLLICLIDKYFIDNIIIK